MKKTFLARRNALFSSTDLSWGAYALTGALLLLAVRLLAPNFFWHVVTPLFRGADVVTTESHSFFSSFANAAQLALENEKLSAENTALMSENQALIQKDLNLTALFGAAGQKTGMAEVLASVVAHPPESPYDTFLLAEGSTAGVTLGMEAFGEGNVPVGVVSSVLPNFSRVTLFSASGVTTHGWVGSSIPLTIVGSGGGTLSATLARSAVVVVGDTVFVAGPAQLPIGKVVRVDSDPSSPSVTLRIQPALNLFSVSWVVLRDTGIALLDTLPQQ